MKVKLLRACMVAGKAAKAEETVDVPDADAKYLVHAGRAEFVDKKPEKAKADATKA